MKIPTVTYRIQFNGKFTFRHAEDILEYLKALGISHIYSSPIFRSKKGSTHGYDVVDPGQIDEELGGEKGFSSLTEKTARLEIGWIQDIVPNHMAFDSENSILMDVFEKGRASRFFDFFDVNWDHPYENLRGRVLAPFLGSFYGACLDRGDISLAAGARGFYIKYYDLELPVFLGLYAGILRQCFNAYGTGESRAYGRIIDVFETLNIEEQDAVDAAKKELWELLRSDTAAGDMLEVFLEKINNGTEQALEKLHQLLSGQFFRLAFWKVGNDELNYRRFFTVNTLICLKMENMDVFEHVHGRVLGLIEEGRINGLRLDHIDGLYSPRVYLRRLRERVPDCYVVAEKILCAEEEIHGTWPIQGTTGYEFLNHLNGIFIDTGAVKLMSRTYRSFSGTRQAFNDIVPGMKRLFMGKHMAGDIDNLAHQLKDIFTGQRDGSDLTMYGLRRALVEVMSHFPVYRTYASELGISDSDKFYIKQALDRARRAQSDLSYELDYLEKVLLADPEIKIGEKGKEVLRDFTKRFQQISGPLMAKGAEDTAFYIYNRLISLNEVGGSPDRFGETVDSYHDFNRKRTADWPYSMSATATHDTKRGEDARVRIDLLSEIPDEWDFTVRAWHKMNRGKKTKANGVLVPDNNEEYFLYQTLVGSFPFFEEEIDMFRDRVKDYIIKAVREAKVNSSWLNPDENYEKAYTAFVDGILATGSENLFLDEFRRFQKKVSYFGVFNSISQVVLKLTSPGVPDIYQGTELWDLSLVDPDNRRPVDFEVRKNILQRVKASEDRAADLAGELLTEKETGGIKLFTIYKTLKFRNEHSGLFTDGEYIPLSTGGKYARNIVAFARRAGTETSVVIVPRFLSKVIQEGDLPLGSGVWQDTEIHLPDKYPSRWKNIITGQEIETGGSIKAGTVMEFFPGAVLMGI